MSLLKTLKQKPQLANLQIKIPAALASRLSNVCQSAAKAGMALDLDQPLSKALARVLHAAEVELLACEPQPQMSVNLEGISHG